MATLLQYLKEQGCTTASLVDGPNGNFVSATKKDGSIFRLPVGKKSQGGKLSEYNILTTDNGQVIATMNQYEELDTVKL